MPALTRTVACPHCGTAGAPVSPVIHHLICAYVGPEYDFAEGDGSSRCPKCRRALGDAPDWEVVSDSARCAACDAEFIVDAAAPDCHRIAPAAE